MIYGKKLEKENIARNRKYRYAIYPQKISCFSSRISCFEVTPKDNFISGIDSGSKRGGWDRQCWDGLHSWKCQLSQGIKIWLASMFFCAGPYGWVVAGPGSASFYHHCYFMTAVRFRVQFLIFSTSSIWLSFSCCFLPAVYQFFSSKTPDFVRWYSMFFLVLVVFLFHKAKFWTTSFDLFFIFTLAYSTYLINTTFISNNKQMTNNENNENDPFLTARERFFR